MINYHRGESILILGEQRYVLVPSFKVLVGIEGELNCSVLDLISKISRGQFLQLKEMEVVIRHSLSKPIDCDLMDLIYQDGVIKIFPQIVNFLKNALNIEESYE